jgi:hypothetical protein
MVALLPSVRNLPSAAVSLPETARAGVREEPRRTSIDTHLAAAADARRRSQPVILDLEAVDVVPSGQTTFEVLSTFQVLVTYLRHDLTTPLSQPPYSNAHLSGSATSRAGKERMAPEVPRYTWDDQVLPDRLGSFVNSYT